MEADQMNTVPQETETKQFAGDDVQRTFCEDSWKMQRDGYACLYEDASRDLAELDASIRNNVGPSDAVEWSVSSLIDEVDLARCGYISGFPDQLTVVANIATDCRGKVVDKNSISVCDLRCSGKHLTPAACLNIYPMLAQRPSFGNGSITTLATVYRHEPNGFEGLFRLWEFKVREFVFVGTQAFVQSMLEQAKVAAMRLAADRRLNARLVGASDHFYPSRANAVRQKLQLQTAMKHELVTTIRQRDLALSSFNFHGTHFSRAYGFDDRGARVTACAGFGLHRWLGASPESRS
jgi:hypothetical protein